MKGRKAKPTALKLLAGNAGRRPINQNEPQSGPLDAATPPEWLGPEAVYFWHKLAAITTSMNVVQESDRFALANLATVLACLKGANDTFDYKSIPSLMSQATRLMAEFGLTPASRSKIQALATGEDENEFAKYLSGGKA